MISVYRIYIAQAWRADGTAAELLRLLDGIPEFFYRTSIASLDEPPGEVGTQEARAAAVRIAMTQAHVVIVPADSHDHREWSDSELRVARTGFRHRIPVLAVRSPAEGATLEPIGRMADLSVSWNADQIACGILDVVEAAAAERREALRQFEAVDHAPHPAAATNATPAHELPRALPVAQILEAYAELRATRSGDVAGSV